MRDKPILFSGPMVRALLEGRKTQTRRVLKTETVVCREEPWRAHLGKDGVWRILADDRLVEGLIIPVLPYAVGDRLWVRETWSAQFWDPEDIDGAPREFVGTPVAERTRDLLSNVYYRVEEAAKEGILAFVPEGHWTPGIHMPRWASRLTLTVTDVRIQRVGEISEEDAVAEGVALAEPEVGSLGGYVMYGPRPATDARWSGARDSYHDLWNHLNAKRGFGWDVNPWVVAVTFAVEQRNIDQVPTP